MSIRGEVVTYLRQMAGGVWLTRWPWMFKHGLRAVIMCNSGARSKPYDMEAARVGATPSRWWQTGYEWLGGGASRRGGIVENTVTLQV
jgi:hypothetical protein